MDVSAQVRMPGDDPDQQGQIIDRNLRTGQKLDKSWTIRLAGPGERIRCMYVPRACQTPGSLHWRQLLASHRAGASLESPKPLNSGHGASRLATVRPTPTPYY
jgi:hypothetical protein